MQHVKARRAVQPLRAPLRPGLEGRSLPSEWRLCKMLKCHEPMTQQRGIGAASQPCWPLAPAAPNDTCADPGKPVAGSCSCAAAGAGLAYSLGNAWGWPPNLACGEPAV